MADHTHDTQTAPDWPKTPEEQIFDTTTECTIRQTTPMTRMRSPTRKRLITRGLSPTTEAITINNVEKSSSRDHVPLFNTPKDRLDDGIKLAMEALFTVLQIMVTQQMEHVMA